MRRGRRRSRAARGDPATDHPERRGETDARWETVRSSLCSDRAQASDEFRRGNVRFAGDADHLVPNFGVRGTRSGLEDAAADDEARVVFPAGPVPPLAMDRPEPAAIREALDLAAQLR